MKVILNSIYTPKKTNNLSSRMNYCFTLRQYDNDSVTFGSLQVKYGKLPKELENTDISHLDIENTDVTEVNKIGYTSEVLKLKKGHKLYAVKRLLPAKDVRLENGDIMMRQKTEAEVYSRVNGLNNIPKFYYCRCDFSKNRPENNYIIMSWVNGQPASERGVSYDFSLINNKKLSRIYSLLEKFDERGVMHNDLWAGNLLFTDKDVNIIDFNASYLFDSKKSQDTNLKSFKERFLYRYFSDLYLNKGEDVYLDTFKISLKLERDYQKKKLKFYKKSNNLKAVESLNYEIKNIDKILKNPEMLKQKALQIIFDSDVRCAKIFSKHFEFGDDEALFHYKKALNVLNKHPEIAVEGNQKKIIYTNMCVIKRLSTAINSDNQILREKNLRSGYELLNSDIYSDKEKQEVYYDKFKRFCELSLNMKNSCNNYSDILNASRLREYFDTLI